MAPASNFDRPYYLATDGERIVWTEKVVQESWARGTYLSDYPQWPTSRLERCINAVDEQPVNDCC